MEKAVNDAKSEETEYQNETCAAFVDQSDFSSGKKIRYRGPLKKRSPKFLQDSVSKLLFDTPTSSVPSTLPGLVSTRTDAESLPSISSLSRNYMRNLPSSVSKTGNDEDHVQLPLNRRLSDQLMSGPLLTTPHAVSSAEKGSFAILSASSNLECSNSERGFCFPKRPKTYDNSVFNGIQRSNKSTVSISTTSEIKSRQKEEEAFRFVDKEISNQTPGKENQGSAVSSGLDILRITHPFGDHPRVTVRRVTKRPVANSPLVILKKTRPIEGDNLLDSGRRKTEFKKEREGHVINRFRATIEHASPHADRTRLHLPVFSPLLPRFNSYCGPTTVPGQKFLTTKPTVPKVQLVDKSPFIANALAPQMQAKVVKVSAETIRCNIIRERRDLFHDVEVSTRPCKCTKTRCLKLYCECFHRGTFCNPEICKCTQCLNTQVQNGTELPRGRRVTAMLEVLMKKPDAFSGKGRASNTKGCRCKKSRCLNKFCECVASSKKCSDDCSCKDCLNQKAFTDL